MAKYFGSDPPVDDVLEISYAMVVLHYINDGHRSRANRILWKRMGERSRVCFSPLSSSGQMDQVRSLARNIGLSKDTIDGGGRELLEAVIEAVTRRNQGRSPYG